MPNEFDPDAELERLEKARERIRQLRAKVKYLNDQISGSRYAEQDRDRALREDRKENATPPRDRAG